jgi:nucleoside-diphosphate-sugar epimerase
LARAGDVDLTFNLSLVETMDDRSVTVHGSSGIARLNFAADTLVTTVDNAADIVLNPFLFQMSHAWKHMREGFVNAGRHITSLNRQSAYGVSFENTVASFYNSVKMKTPVDDRYSAQSAVIVMKTIESAIAMMPNSGVEKIKKPIKTKACKPTVLVIGGTGFIGRHLTRSLVAKGNDVRVLSRSNNGPFSDLGGKVETFSASLKDPERLRVAMEGIDTVYHLAKSMDKTWEDCLENDVGVTRTIAEAALDQGVMRFVYTGTIASYDMSNPDVEITEATSFDANMEDRNLYARSKAACEACLMEMHRSKGLPLVIARPGIVLGAGGPLQHWGIGRWQGAGTVRIWGHGHNILPFVLIDDVCDGLIRMMESDKIVGQSFNLVGEPMMSARDYFDAIYETMGARIRVKSGSLHGLYLADGVKYLLKRYALRRHGVIRPSLSDWKSRAHFSPFRIDDTKEMLDWAPEKNRDIFVQKAIVDAGLFGF